MGRRDDILSKAVILFNEKGTKEITTNHIAEAMNISPGNLYYYFRNKEEIIRAVFLIMVDKFTLLWQNQEVLTVDKIVGKIYGNLDIYWEYRFLYNELPVLLKKDSELKKIYNEIKQQRKDEFTQMFVELKKKKIVKSEMDDSDIKDMVEMIWFFSEFYILKMEIDEKPFQESHSEYAKNILRIISPCFIVN